MVSSLWLVGVVDDHSVAAASLALKSGKLLLELLHQLFLADGEQELSLKYPFHSIWSYQTEWGKEKKRGGREDVIKKSTHKGSEELISAAWKLSIVGQASLNTQLLRQVQT